MRTASHVRRLYTGPLVLIAVASRATEINVLLRKHREAPSGGNPLTSTTGRCLQACTDIAKGDELVRLTFQQSM
jgi:hypothetical protein